jgi:biotin carboxyl carrier protein
MGRAHGMGPLMPQGPSVIEISPGELILEQDGRRMRMFVAVDGEVSWVFFEGHVYQLEIAERTARLKPGATMTGATKTTVTKRSHAGMPGAVTAPMPATVLRIQAKPGATVKKGDTLIVLEAMKMEMPLRSPQDGTIAAVHCAEGQLVQPGVSLVEFVEA